MSGSIWAFVQGLLATFIGTVLGFLVALYIDRRQRAEEAGSNGVGTLRRQSHSAFETPLLLTFGGDGMQR